MGIHKYIKDLDPEVLYTFDPRDSFIDIATSTGVYINNTEYDFPSLEIKNSGLFYKKNMDFVNPAVSGVENSSLYKSFGNGSFEYYYGSARNSDGKFPINFKMNVCSSYTEADYADHYDSIIDSEKYTIFFQTSAFYDGTITNQVLPLYLKSLEEDSQYVSRFGYFSYAEFANPANDILQPKEISFGFNLINSALYDISPTSYFGFGSTSNITFNPFKTEGSEVVQLIDFLSHPTYNYNSYGLQHSYFKFGNITLVHQNIANDNYRIGIIDNFGATNYFVSSPQNKNISIAIEVDVINNNAKVYVNKQDFVFCQLPTEHDKILKIGYETRWEEHNSILPADQPIIKYNAFRAYYPSFNVKFDNVAIYKRALSKEERINLFDLNMNFLDRYAEYGYSQLYDFSDLYDKDSTRYIENNTMVLNLLGTSYLYSNTSRRKIEEMPYVVRYIDEIKEYSFRCVKHSSISSGRNNNTDTPISMIRTAGTLTFLFKTNSMDGLLFSNTQYESVDTNINIFFNSGFFELWIGSSLKTRVDGFSNGVFHKVDIIFGSNSALIYINEVLYYTHIGRVIDTSAMTIFGNGLPGNRDFDCEFALIAFSGKQLTLPEIISFKSNINLYSARGQVTLNNIAVGTNVYICNRDTGELIEILISSEIDGTFVYTNRYPYTITVIVTDTTLLNGRSYIVDPVEVK